MDIDPEQTDVVEARGFPNRPWLTLLLALLVVGAYVLTQTAAVGIYLAAELIHNPKLDLEAWVEKAEYNGSIIAVCTLAATAVSVPLLFVAARLLGRGSVGERLGLRVPDAITILKWLLAMGALIAVTDGLTWLFGRDIVPPFMRQAYATAGSPVLLWLALVVAAPLAEELLFRGFLFGALARSSLGVSAAAVITSLAWAVLHLQYDFFGMASIFVAGLLLAAARHSTQSVIVCILMHSTMNLVATLEVVAVLEKQ